MSNRNVAPNDDSPCKEVELPPVEVKFGEWERLIVALADDGDGVQIADLDRLKEQPGLYRFWVINPDGRHETERVAERWYVGQSKDLKRRLSEYVAASRAESARTGTTRRLGLGLARSFELKWILHVHVMTHARLMLRGSAAHDGTDDFIVDADLGDLAHRLLVESAVVAWSSAVDRRNDTRSNVLGVSADPKATKARLAALDEVFDGLHQPVRELADIETDIAGGPVGDA